MNRHEVAAGFSSMLSIIKNAQMSASTKEEYSVFDLLYKKTIKLRICSIAASVPYRRVVDAHAMEVIKSSDAKRVTMFVRNYVQAQFEDTPIIDLTPLEGANLVISALSKCSFDGDSERFLDQVMRAISEASDSSYFVETYIFIETVIREALFMDALNFGADYEEKNNGDLTRHLIFATSAGKMRQNEDAKTGELDYSVVNAASRLKKEDFPNGPSIRH